MIAFLLSCRHPGAHSLLLAVSHGLHRGLVPVAPKGLLPPTVGVGRVPTRPLQMLLTTEELMVLDPNDMEMKPKRAGVISDLK